MSEIGLRAAGAGEPIQLVRDALSALEAASSVRREGKTRATRWFAAGAEAPRKAEEPAAAKPKAKAATGDRKRATPKADALEALRDELGTVPDRVIAERIGASAEMVRLFRRQHGIPGIQERGGPLPPRARRSAPAAPKAEPRPAPKAEPQSPPPARSQAPAGGSAWRVRLRDGQVRIVIGADVAQAAAFAAERLGDAAISIEWLEQLLDA